MRTRLPHALLPLTLLLAACATTPATTPVHTTAAPAGLGLSRETAIEVCMPGGQRDYLSRLLCPGGRPAAFERIGSVGPRQPIPDTLSEAELDRQFEDMLSGRPFRAGDPDYHIVDAYRVACGATDITVYLDMYHCGVAAPDAAPEGFGIGR